SDDASFLFALHCRILQSNTISQLQTLGDENTVSASTAYLDGLRTKLGTAPDISQDLAFVLKRSLHGNGDCVENAIDNDRDLRGHAGSQSRVGLVEDDAYIEISRNRPAS